MTYNLLKLYVLIDMGYFFVFNFLYCFLKLAICVSYILVYYFVFNGTDIFM